MVTGGRYATVITLLLAIVAGLAVPSASGAASSRAAYSSAVTQICKGALLFEGSHAIGTRAGALAVADDIRASTRRRLHRVNALSDPPRTEGLVERWTTLERRLANTYAESWVAIYDVIAATHRPNAPERRGCFDGSFAPPSAAAGSRADRAHAARTRLYRWSHRTSRPAIERSSPGLVG